MKKIIVILVVFLSFFSIKNEVSAQNNSPISIKFNVFKGDSIKTYLYNTLSVDTLVSIKVMIKISGKNTYFFTRESKEWRKLDTFLLEGNPKIDGEKIIFSMENQSKITISLDDINLLLPPKKYKKVEKK